jgi:hypothetical protein
MRSRATTAFSLFNAVLWAVVHSFLDEVPIGIQEADVSNLGQQCDNEHLSPTERYIPQNPFTGSTVCVRLVFTFMKSGFKSWFGN